MRRLGLAAALALIVSACGSGTTADEPTTTAAPAQPSTTTTTMAHDDHGDHGDAGDEVEEPADDEAAHDGAADHEAAFDEYVVEGDGRVVEVTMTEWGFDPDPVEVTAGEMVTFVVYNAGVVEHEFRLSNAHRIEEHIASGHEGHHGDDSGGHHEDGDVVLIVDAGAIGEITVTVPMDATIFTHTACLLPGHYEAGMEGLIHYT